jgi:DNA polymerase-1
MNKNILFLDAYNLIYRSLSGWKSGPNFVIYNFFRNLRPLIEKHNPDKVYFVLEGNPEFRAKLSEGNYKSNRKSKGENFHRQKASIINIVKSCFPFIIARHPSLECDDTIATLCVDECKKGNNCTIISSDSDFIQLLNLNQYNIKLYNPIKKKFIPQPDYDYVTWKALRGDATDNIKGIKGVGDKTALKLVKDKNLLVEFLKDPEKQKIFDTNLNLIRLVDFSNDFNSLEHSSGKADYKKLYDIFKDLEFNSIIAEKTWKKYLKTFEGL